MRLGILDCDHIDDRNIEWGNYYSARLISQLSPRLPGWRFSSYAAIDGELPKDIHCADAYLITGSRFNVDEPYAWNLGLQSFLNLCIAQSKKLIGICFGHQLLAHLLGGTVANNPSGWHFGYRDVYPIANAKWMGEILTTNLRLPVAHLQQVTQLPDGARRLLQCDYCPNFMFDYQEQILGIQGHPEFSASYLAILIDKLASRFPEQNLALARSSMLNQKHDCEQMMDGVASFLIT